MVMNSLYEDRLTLVLIVIDDRPDMELHCEVAEFEKWGIYTRWYFNITNNRRIRLEKHGEENDYLNCL